MTKVAIMGAGLTIGFRKWRMGERAVNRSRITADCYRSLSNTEFQEAVVSRCSSREYRLVHSKETYGYY